MAKLVSQEQSKKYCGVETFTLVAVNPNAKQLKEMFNSEDEREEIEYIKPTTHKFKKDGEEHEVEVDQVRLDFWMRGEKSQVLRPYTVYIKNTLAYGKENGFPLYVSQFGNFSISENQMLLEDWFTTKRVYNRMNKSNYQDYPIEYRQALVGEIGLVNFLKAFLGNSFNNFNIENSLLFDMKAIFKGKFGEIQELLEPFMNSKKVVGCLFVKIKETDGEFKEYQSIENTLLKYEDLKNFRNFAKDNWTTIPNAPVKGELDENGKKKRDNYYDLRHFVENIKKKSEELTYNLLHEVSEYNPEENRLNSNEALITDSNANY